MKSMAEALDMECPWLRPHRRSHGCVECCSLTAAVYWGDGCSDCKPDLELDDAGQSAEDARTDAAIDRWKDERP